MLRRLALECILILSLTSAASARDHWICVHSPNFELYTASDEESGRAALTFFEEVRRAFTESLGLKLPENKPLTIIAFRDEAGFAPFRPQNGVAAFTIALSSRSFIVMQDLVPEHYSVALHEYTHVIIDQAGMKLPLWLNEGFAEFFATLRPEGQKIVVGRVIPDRLQSVQSGMYGLHDVLTADRQSPLYHDDKRAGLFHAESWALVHMLKFSELYAPHFDQVLDAIGRGGDSEHVLQNAYGKTTPQIQADLAAYIHRGKFREGVIHARLEKSGPEPALAQVDPINIEVVLAGLEALGAHRKEAVQNLQDLARENRSNPAPFEALAGIQADNKDYNGAVDSLQHALDAGTHNAMFCLQLAIRLKGALPDTEYVAALHRAVELEPDLSVAQQLLAEQAFNTHNYAETVKRLHLVKKLERANAFTYYRMLSLSAVQTGDQAEARSAAGRAQQFASTAEEKRIAEDIVKFVGP
jgi:hypothetical protein